MALFKRKDKENKKGSENAIGKIIYGFLLFMPLLSIGARCLYVIFNKNAYQSYANQESLQYTLVDNQSELTANKNYQFTTNQELVSNNNRDYIIFNTISTLGGFTTEEVSQVVHCNRFRYYVSQNGKFLHFTDNVSRNFYLSFANSSGTLTRTLQFNYEQSNTISNPYLDNIALIQYGESNYLDNVFEYSIEQTQQSNLYNWASNTGTYTVLHNTTTGLGITNTFIPMLMAYWLIVSVIYFLFDIALILIWAVHKKIHELSEAI